VKTKACRRGPEGWDERIDRNRGFVALAYIYFGIVRCTRAAALWVFHLAVFLIAFGLIILLVVVPASTFARWVPSAPGWLLLPVMVAPLLLLFLAEDLFGINGAFPVHRAFDLARGTLRRASADWRSGLTIIANSAILAREQKRLEVAKQGEFILVLRSWISVDEFADTRTFRAEPVPAKVSPADRESGRIFLELLGRSLPLPVVCLADPADTVFPEYDCVVSPLPLRDWEQQVRELIRAAKSIVVLDIRVSDSVNMNFIRELDWISALGRVKDSLLTVIGRGMALDLTNWTPKDSQMPFLKLRIQLPYGFNRQPTRLTRHYPHFVVVSADGIWIRVDGASETIREAARLAITAGQRIRLSSSSLNEHLRGANASSVSGPEEPM